MTPREACIASRELEAKIGLKGRVSIYLHGKCGELPLAASLYDNWPMGDPIVTTDGHDFEEVITGLRVGWANYQDQHNASTVRKMALKIITITAEHGRCTQAALRMTHEFSEDQIAKYGEAACEEADKLAANGPFKIVKIDATANAA
jgi:hypothetical protein